jgi:hypothetical protein
MWGFLDCRATARRPNAAPRDAATAQMTHMSEAAASPYRRRGAINARPGASYSGISPSLAISGEPRDANSTGRPSRLRPAPSFVPGPGKSRRLFGTADGDGIRSRIWSAEVALPRRILGMQAKPDVRIERSVSPKRLAGARYGRAHGPRRRGVVPVLRGLGPRR